MIRVRRIQQLDDGDTVVESVTERGEVHRLKTQHVLLAVPPRLAVERIAFEPSLPSALVSDWAHCSTWMAPHAKYLAVYPRPFWREEGLSGSGRSYVGPMVEIHDASPVEGMGAIFGFIGVPAATRHQVPAVTLIALCRAQMVRLFGAEASSPTAEWLKDWSQDECTATPAMRKSGALAGDLVAIQGIGGLGHLALQYARKMGLRVVAVGRGADIADEVKALGAHRYIDTHHEDPVQQLQAMGGAQLILTTITDSAAASALVPALALKGKFLVVGVGKAPLAVAPGFLVSGERVLEGSITGTPHESERTLDFSVLTDRRYSSPVMGVP